MAKKVGGNGDDELIGNTGHDKLYGNDGDDDLSGGDGRDHITGGDGDDTLDGGAGRDTLYGGDGDDLLSGGAGDDKLIGQDGHDSLDGGAGNDRLAGNNGDDRLYGAAGHDKLYGGDGDDLLSGGDGHDRLHGGDGHDTLAGGTGDDRLYGGDGDDTFIYRTGDGNDYINGQSNIDTIRLEVDDGWVLSLTKGTIASEDGDHVQFSGSAAGTITLADGSTIRFKNIERIEAVAGEPDADDPLPMGLELVAEPVDEDAPDGSVVGTAVTAGSDALAAHASVDGAEDGLTHSLTDDAGGRFAIDPKTGVITVADGAALDYENAAQHSIEITVTNAAGHSASQTFTIEVADANEAPESLALSANEVAENAAGGTVVGTVSAADPDAGDTLTYALTDDAGGRFTIDPDTGVITVASPMPDVQPVASWDLDRSLDGRDQKVVIDHDASFELDQGTVSLSFTPDQVSGRQGLFSKDSLHFDDGGHLSIWLEGGQVVARLQSASEDHQLYSDPGAVSAGETTEVAVSFGDEGFRLYVGGELVDQSSYTGGIADNGEPLVLGADALWSGDGTADNLKHFFNGTIHAVAVYDQQREQLPDGAAPDDEAGAQHSVEVTVTDAGGLSTSQTFTIDVTDVDEAPGTLALDASEVAEDAGEGTVVGTAAVVDSGPGGAFTYALTDDAGGRFAIDPDTGVLTVADGAMLDYESAAQHDVTVEVTDAGGLSASQTFTIDVTNVNEAPGGLALSAGAVQEGAAGGTVVGTASASDPDAGDTLIYSLSDDAGGRFTIDPDTGVITVADGAPLDHADAAQHSVEVTVTNGGGLASSETFTIDVGESNEAPGGLGLGGGAVAEGALAGTVVGTISATDPDGDALSYSLTHDAGGRFAIDPETGVITVADGAILDHESAAQHNIEVTVTDAGGLIASQTFTIEVTDVNEAPGIVAPDPSEVAENAAAGTLVGTVGASDPDAGDTLTFALADDAGGRFAIDPTTGAITVADGASLDHADAAQHSVTVEVTDAGGLTSSRTFTVEVTDVNESPSIVGLDAAGVAENATGDTVVGTVSAADPDGDALTYSLSDDADGRFAIDPESGLITVADGAVLDHESTAQHSVTVEVTDAGGLTSSQTFTIAVSDVNEVPGDLALSASAVQEGAPGGTMAGTASASDPDAGDTLTFALADDAGGRFVIDPETGVITVADGAVLDHESAAQHSVTVEMTDAGGLTSSETFSIEVTDLNEAPDGLSLDASEVAENAPGGTVVGTASAGDPDAGDTLTYALTDDAGGRFAVDPATGVITVADGAVLDHEAAAQHSVTVQVTDAGGLTTTHSFVIDVTDVNEAPDGLSLDASEVTENAPGGTIVGTASASDPDAGDTSTYALADDAGGRFAIDPDSGVITVADDASFDHDTAAQHNITVEVTDAGGLSTTRAFTVAVLPVNDAPSIGGLSADEVQESVLSGAVVGTVSASDPDPEDSLTYALSDDAGGRFAIDPDTGLVTVADGSLLDHESAGQHDIEVVVTDAEGLSTTRAFTIAVADVNEAPAIAGIDPAEVAENAAQATVVGAVGADDPDAGDTLTHALTDDAGGRFAIDPDTGVVTVADGTALDFENAMQHGIEVEVTDAGGLSASRTFMITVTNVNEQPVTEALSANQVIETAADGTVIGAVSALDPDGDAALTFELSDDAGGRFAIDPDTGVVTVADGSLLDYDEADQHSIEVTVTDPGGLSHVATYAIELLRDNSGDDTLFGDAGDNLIDGGPGDDTIFAEGSDDHLIGGSGHDSLNGGNGADLLEGGDGDDFMFGNNDDDQLFGEAGNDQLFGGSGHDQVFGGAGNDELFGNSGNDVLSGGDGDDILFASLGDDVLIGGAGDDVLSGNSGADRFVFTSLDDGVDEIVDFDADDVLAIGEMLVEFADGDEAAFVRLVDDGTDTTVQVDVDGAPNGEAYQSIAVLSGVSGDSLDDLVNAGQIDFWMS